MEEKKNKNKGLIVAIVILILLVLGLGGYIVYDKVLKEEPVKVEEPKEVIEELDFYDVSELVKNKYIKKVENHSDNTDKHIKIENDIVYIIDYETLMQENYYALEELSFVKTTGIEGTPSVVTLRAIQSPTNAIFLVLTKEGDLYYSFASYGDTEPSSVKEFKKINSDKVLNLYSLYNTQIISYPQEKTPTLYAELENGKLMEINMESQMTKTFKEAWPYIDKICGLHGGDGYCPGLVISSERTLATEKYDENKNVIANAFEEIKYENQVVKVKDAFSILDEETAKYYIISMDNQLFEIVQKNYKIESIKLYKEQKVKDFVFNYVVEEDSMPKFKSVEITYEDNSNETFKNIFAISTLYERYNK